jgi:hypothetical protein
MNRRTESTGRREEKQFASSQAVIPAGCAGVSEANVFQKENRGGNARL